MADDQVGWLSALTSLDLAVVAGLAVLALVLWFVRRLLRYLSRFLPALAAVLGFGGAYAGYRLADHMGWDSPGSPAIIVVVGGLMASALVGLAGFVGLGLQLRLWRGRRGATPPSSAPVGRGPALGDVGVFVFIWLVVTSLWRVYEFRKSEEPSHTATVTALAYGSTARQLYSLDTAGILKRWDLTTHREAARWTLGPVPTAEALLVAPNQEMVLVLDQGTLRRVDLRSVVPAEPVWGGPGIRALWQSTAEGGGFLVGDDPWAFDFERAPRRLVTPGAFRPAAVTATGRDTLAVATRDGELAFLRLDGDRLLASGDPPNVVLGFQAERIRSDREGRRLLVAGGDRVALVDMERGEQIPLSSIDTSTVFEITQRGRGLFVTLASLRGYDTRSREFLTSFSHGGAITVLTVSPADDSFAVAMKNQVFHCQDTYNYVSETEVRLRGALALPDLAALRGRADLVAGTPSNEPHATLHAGAEVRPQTIRVRGEASHH